MTDPNTPEAAPNLPVFQRHNIKQQLLSMLAEEVPAAREKLAFHRKQVARLQDWLGYLESVASPTGFSDPTPPMKRGSDD